MKKKKASQGKAQEAKESVSKAIIDKKKSIRKNDTSKISATQFSN